MAYSKTFLLLGLLLAVVLILSSEALAREHAEQSQTMTARNLEVGTNGPHTVVSGHKHGPGSATYGNGKGPISKTEPGYGGGDDPFSRTNPGHSYKGPGQKTKPGHGAAEETETDEN